MTRLEKINDVAERYQVSTRSLRYYEEIGTLWSERPDPSKPRTYTPEALRRLEQILALRRLDTPIREIQRIVTAQDPSVALGAFAKQLHTIECEARTLRVRRERVESLLALFRREQRERPLEGPDLPDVIAALAERAARQGQQEGARFLPAESLPQSLNVRIVTLAPMRVARYHDPVAPSCFDSWRHMIGWACGYELNSLPTTRAFGETTPNPEAIIPKYGYDVIMGLPDGFEPRGHIVADHFPGGLFAVASTTYRDYVKLWEALSQWVKESPDYERRAGAFLEELHVFDFPVGWESKVDLFYPVAPCTAT